VKKLPLVLLFFQILFTPALLSQVAKDYSKIDLMLIRGEYDKAIDTCKLILGSDSLNAEIFYKMGLAYQNQLPDDKSFDCFMKAMTISPDNNIYIYMVAKAFFSKNKFKQAGPLFENLCRTDSMNWNYAYYLTSVYLQEERYDDAIYIYRRFYDRDPENYVYLDKLGFANLRKGNNEKAIDFFSRSLTGNPKNINAIKNISYLYAITHRIDTAIQLLKRGIEIDPTDMDLYARRAALNYSLHYTKRALDDYLVILASGDSTLLYIKRAGIGYANNLQPKESNVYLLKAFQKDTTDLETMTFLARNYSNIKDFKKSAFYYRQIIKTITPLTSQLSLTYILLGEELKSDGRYKEAINAYITSQVNRSDPSIIMIIANIYDEKLNDIPKAIYYYQKFLNNQKSLGFVNDDYMQKIKDRVEALKKMSENPKK
jgi:tetratricopeptide (TPR) repeat protein